MYCFIVFHGHRKWNPFIQPVYIIIYTPYFWNDITCLNRELAAIHFSTFGLWKPTMSLFDVQTGSIIHITAQMFRNIGLKRLQSITPF